MKRNWTRRDFIHSVGVATASLAAGGVASKAFEDREINKREALLALLDPSKEQDYIPAAFFLHFDELYHQGPEAIEKHLEFFRYTGMDFVKIQYEIRFPPIPDIKTPADWATSATTTSAASRSRSRSRAATMMSWRRRTEAGAELGRAPLDGPTMLPSPPTPPSSA